jgi:hypothetical protein
MSGILTEGFSDFLRCASIVLKRAAFERRKISDAKIRQGTQKMTIKFQAFIAIAVATFGLVGCKTHNVELGV